jgi:hypothetical protein
LDNGPGNTTALVRRGNHYEAAIFCDQLSFAGYDDWFLPAQEELKLLVRIPSGNSGIQRNLLYWSSTENNQNNAVSVVIDFNGNPTVSYTKKSDTALVRCMRRW